MVSVMQIKANNVCGKGDESGGVDSGVYSGLEPRYWHLREKKMSPGGGFGQQITESCITFVDLNAAMSNLELRSSPFKKTASNPNINLGTSSTNDVHELLECPVCMNLMYPPIYQVLP